jgi:hypothetical protein
MGFNGMRKDELLKPSELQKIIYSLNVRDYGGQVYFPEVMWAVFYSVVGFSNDKLHKLKSNKKLLKKIKNKYKMLSPTMTMDDLCGNSFYRNQMTVTKYIAGRMILTKLRKLVALRKENEKKNGKDKIAPKQRESDYGKTAGKLVDNKDLDSSQEFNYGEDMAYLSEEKEPVKTVKGGIVPKRSK